MRPTCRPTKNVVQKPVAHCNIVPKSIHNAKIVRPFAKQHRTITIVEFVQISVKVNLNTPTNIVCDLTKMLRTERERNVYLLYY